MADIKDKIVTLAATLKSNFTTTEGGVLTASEDFIAKALPEDLTVETIQSVSNFLTDLTAAGQLAVGELAIEAMKADKGLEYVSTAPIKICDGLGIEWDFKRSHMVPNGDRENPGRVEAFGRSSATISLKAVHNAGQYKVVRKHLSALATEAFGS